MYEVTAEITLKIYTTLISQIWDAGEILLYRQKLEKAKS